MSFINVADITNPETGKTYREENNEMNHSYEINSLVELKESGGVRLFVVKHTRDCDGTPLYSLSFVPSVKIPTKKSYVGQASSRPPFEIYYQGYEEGQIAGMVLDGYSEDDLTLINTPINGQFKPEHYSMPLYDWENKEYLKEKVVDGVIFRLYRSSENNDRLATFVRRAGGKESIYHLLTFGANYEVKTLILREHDIVDEVRIGRFDTNLHDKKWVFVTEENDELISESFIDKPREQALELLEIAVLNWFYRECFIQ